MCNICVLIVTYNGEKWIDKCLSSVFNSTVKTDIIVVDNCSVDGTKELLRSYKDKATLIFLPKNVGFGQANNIGLREVINKKYEYVFFMNQDAWVLNDSIEKLIHCFKENDKYGIISPLHINSKGDSLEIGFCGYLSNTLKNSVIYLSDIFIQKQVPNLMNTTFVNAALWMARSVVIKKVGGFDPLFFHYGEDNNLINRIRYHGYKIGICTNTCAIHDRENFSVKSELFSKNYYYRNKLIIFTNPAFDYRFSSLNIEILHDIWKSLIQLKLKYSVIILFAYLKFLKDYRIVKGRKKIYESAECFIPMKNDSLFEQDFE